MVQLCNKSQKAVSCLVLKYSNTEEMLGELRLRGEENEELK